jgi:hypothetical protein
MEAFQNVPAGKWKKHRDFKLLGGEHLGRSKRFSFGKGTQETIDMGYYLLRISQTKSSLL